MSEYDIQQQIRESYHAQEIAPLVDGFHAINQKRKELEQEEQRIKDKLKEHMTRLGVSRLDGDTATVKMTHATRTTLPKDRVRQVLGDDWIAANQSITNYTSLSVSSKE